MTARSRGRQTQIGAPRQRLPTKLRVQLNASVLLCSPSPHGSQRRRVRSVQGTRGHQCGGSLGAGDHEPDRTQESHRPAWIHPRWASVRRERGGDVGIVSRFPLPRLSSPQSLRRFSNHPCPGSSPTGRGLSSSTSVGVRRRPTSQAFRNAFQSPDPPPPSARKGRGAGASESRFAEFVLSCRLASEHVAQPSLRPENRRARATVDLGPYFPFEK